MPGELPLVLLALLAEQPQGGYQLLGELSRRFAPTYRPSPGGVYPALAALRAEGLAKQVSGRGSEYRLTARGRSLLAEKRELLDQIEARTNATLEPGTTLQPTIDRLVARVAELRDRVDRAAVERILENATKALADLEVRNEV
jgi:DNA-binding PadR family transcriptional regulator